MVLRPFLSYKGVTTIRRSFYRHLTGDPGVSSLVSVLYKTVYFVKCGAVSRKTQKKFPPRLSTGENGRGKGEKRRYRNYRVTG